ncbi:MAG: lipoate--protein ligase family protein [Desulfurococcales archaeon]|nr:lipoate--protein ligase family protein [Desulfurococcales archaeon]
MIDLVIDYYKDPYKNLALEEVLLSSACLKLRERPIVRIWINDESIIIGRSLRMHDEVNIKLASYYKVPVIRRITGGGAVYHDPGNINFSLITPRNKRMPVNEVYKEGLFILITVLKKLGLNAWIENTNDLIVHGWKVSGSAAYVSNCASLFHSTLLISSNINRLNELLKPRLDRVARGEVTPAKYRPRNLSDFIHISVDEIIEILIDTVSELIGTPIESSYTSSEIEASELLVLNKYSRPEWNIHGKDAYSTRRYIIELLAGKD